MNDILKIPSIFDENMNDFLDIVIKDYLQFLYSIDISSSQLNILMLIYLKKDISIKEIGEFTKTSLPGASQMISRLVKEDYLFKEVVKVNEKTIRNKKVVRLTEKGKDILKLSIQARRKPFLEISNEFSKEEREIVKQSMLIIHSKMKTISKNKKENE